jgi:hypothetical protein
MALTHLHEFRGGVIVHHPVSTIVFFDCPIGRGLLFLNLFELTRVEDTAIL